MLVLTFICREEALGLCVLGKCVLVSWVLGSLQYISGWLFERNRAIGRIALTIILLSWSY